MPRAGTPVAFSQLERSASDCVIVKERRKAFGNLLMLACSTEVIAMLRITANDRPRALTFRLEGRLEGPWVRELEQCWRGLLEEPRRPTVYVDLTGVTYIDAAGRARLAEMHDQGAQFIAGDCATKAIVAEIVREPEGASRPEGEADREPTISA